MHTVPYISDMAPEYNAVVLYNILLDDVNAENVKVLDEAVSSVSDGYFKPNRDNISVCV